MLSVNYTSFLWYASLCKLNSIKAHWERDSRSFSSERLVSLSSPSRSCLGRLILIGGALQVELPHNYLHSKIITSNAPCSGIRPTWVSDVSYALWDLKQISLIIKLYLRKSGGFLPKFLYESFLCGLRHQFRHRKTLAVSWSSPEHLSAEAMSLWSEDIQKKCSPQDTYQLLVYPKQDTQ